MEMEIRVGDRFEWIVGRNRDVWEVTGTHESVCIWHPDSFVIGEREKYNFSDETYWKFIGNFSKANKFIELYNLLNE